MDAFLRSFFPIWRTMYAEIPDAQRGRMAPLTRALRAECARQAKQDRQRRRSHRR